MNEEAGFEAATRGSARALPSGEARSGVAGHVSALKPASAGRRGLELLDTCNTPATPGWAVVTLGSSLRS
jgi:hypothetical protein